MAPRRKLVHRGGAIAAAGLAAAAFGGVAAAATTGSTAATAKIYACYSEKTNTLYHAATATCPTGERLVSWNAAGPQGARGPQGAQGARGAQGSQGGAGAQGTQGPTGVQGAQGSSGVQGPQGSQGARGTQGSQGSQGVQGSQGAQGVQGSQGSQGSQGAKGSQGSGGPQGVQGSQGSQGPQGLQGSQGTQGAQGSRGPQGPAGAASPDAYSGGQGSLNFSTGKSHTMMQLGAGSGSYLVTDVMAFGLHKSAKSSSRVTCKLTNGHNVVVDNESVTGEGVVTMTLTGIISASLSAPIRVECDGIIHYASSGSHSPLHSKIGLRHSRWTAVEVNDLSTPPSAAVSRQPSNRFSATTGRPAATRRRAGE